MTLQEGNTETSLSLRFAISGIQNWGDIMTELPYYYVIGFSARLFSYSLLNKRYP